MTQKPTARTQPSTGFWFERYNPYMGGPFSAPLNKGPAVGPSSEIEADSRPDHPFRPEDNLSVEEFLDLIR